MVAHHCWKPFGLFDTNIHWADIGWGSRHHTIIRHVATDCLPRRYCLIGQPLTDFRLSNLQNQPVALFASYFNRLRAIGGNPDGQLVAITPSKTNRCCAVLIRNRVASNHRFHFIGKFGNLSEICRPLSHHPQRTVSSSQANIKPSATLNDQAAKQTCSD